MHNYQYYKKMTEEALEERLPRIDRRCDTLRKAMTYSLEAGGKRLRPVL
jgi:geranylgeranyl pyrophosphate synthase